MPYSKILPISSYLNGIHAQFQAYLNEGHPLCPMRNLNYSRCNIPDYSDVHFQQYYLLRYAYSYAFEYKDMYLNLFQPGISPMLNDNGQLTVTSIGCGAMLDYWALAHFLENAGIPQTPISYQGIDLVNWDERNRVPGRVQDCVRFCQENVVSTLSQKQQLDSHIYFFPKSISEFTEPDFSQLCNLFAAKPFTFPQVHMMISIRAQTETEEIDSKRAERLRQAVCRNGFTSNPLFLYRVPDERKETKIRDVDPNFPLPREIIRTLTSLYSRCSCYPEDSNGCPSDSDKQACEKELGWYPILRMSNMRYILLTFKRSV